MTGSAPAAAPATAHFDALFRTDADPWRTRTRWYESRKRALTLAALPDERYVHAFEPGCGAGELTAALASRCDRLLSTDASAQAALSAARRVAGAANVRVEQGAIPRDWPAGRFDLVVLSELGYYLAPDELRQVVDACRASLAAGGTLVACHWRRGADDLRHRAEDVHALLRAGCGLAAQSHYEDADFLLDVWSSDRRSVAQREEIA